MIADTTNQGSRLDTFDDQEIQTLVVQQDGVTGPRDSQLMFGVGFASMPVEGDRLAVIEIDSNLYVVGGASQALESALGLNPGERLLFSTDTDGAIQATIRLKADGMVEVGSGSNPVAMADKVDQLWSDLYGVFSGWTPPPAPDSGASLVARFIAAFPPPGPASTASTNLKAD